MNKYTLHSSVLLLSFLVATGCVREKICVPNFRIDINSLNYNDNSFLVDKVIIGNKPEGFARFISYQLSRESAYQIFNSLIGTELPSNAYMMFIYVKEDPGELLTLTESNIVALAIGVRKNDKRELTLYDTRDKVIAKNHRSWTKRTLIRDVEEYYLKQFPESAIEAFQLISISEIESTNI